MTATDTTLRAADAVFVAERAVGRARRVVDDIQTTVTSALRVLDDAELDSAKARLTDRGDFYLEAASEHLGRLQTRCNDIPELTRELFGHLNRASESLNEARGFLDLADTSDPVVAGDVAQLKPRIAVVGEMVALAKPVAQLAAKHVDSARRASQDVTPPALLEPVTLDRSIRTAGKELGRRRPGRDHDRRPDGRAQPAQDRSSLRARPHHSPAGHSPHREDPAAARPRCEDRR